MLISSSGRWTAVQFPFSGPELCCWMQTHAMLQSCSFVFRSIETDWSLFAHETMHSGKSTLMCEKGFAGLIVFHTPVVWAQGARVTVYNDSTRPPSLLASLDIYNIVQHLTVVHMLILQSVLIINMHSLTDQHHVFGCRGDTVIFGHVYW